MPAQLIELVFIPVFILLNGFFSGAELAILSAPRHRLAELAAGGSHAAKAALRLKDTPDRFLPTIQIGITVVGTLAAAIGGVALVAPLESRLADLTGPRFAEPLALIVIVGFISFASLVVGELAPKNLALKFPVPYALAVARPVAVLEIAAMPAVRVLDWVTTWVLLPFGGKMTGSSRVSREELRHVLMEGHRQGVYTGTEQALLHRAIDLVNLTVADAAIPRLQTVSAPPSTPLRDLRTRLLDAPVPYVVLYDSAGDVVHGLLGWREAFGGHEDEPAIERAGKAVYVPESAPLPQAIDQMHAAGAEAAVVVNEYGEFEGLLALPMVWQRQILHLALLQTQLPGVTSIEGGWRVLGATLLANLRERLALPLEDSVFYTTLGGFAMEALGRLPVVNDQFELLGYRFKVTRMAGNRVDEVEIVRI